MNVKIISIKFILLSMLITACSRENTVPSINGNDEEINDTVNPTIKLLGNTSISLAIGEPYIEYFAIANDDKDGDITAHIKINANVDTSKIGNYIVTYDVNDSDGNHAEQLKRVVSVEEKGNESLKFPWDNGKLIISSDKHFLQHENGTAFFWLADTAWQLTQKLNIEEAKRYFTNRKDKDFNVIMVTVGEHQGIVNNKIKEEAFNDTNYASPNEEYFKHLDSIIDIAASKGLYIGLLPAWNMFLDDDREHKGLTNIDDAKVYGEWIAKRYKDRKNIIWIVGGDSTADKKIKKDIWNAMGKAIDTVVKDRQLITYHPTGTLSSSKWFHNEDWLDFNMVQSGHCAPMATGISNLSKDYNDIKPIKPTIDGEPRYETMEECFYLEKNNSLRTGHRFNHNDTREIAYKQIFSGAFGHTYGHHSIWQMSVGKNDGLGVSGVQATVNSWEEALDAKGASQMSYVVKLMKSRPILSRMPAQSTIINNNDAFATKGEGYVFVYLPKGASVTVKLGEISGDTLRASWFDPRTGTSTAIDNTIDKSVDTMEFDTGGTDDMILILDDVSKNYTLFH